MLRTGIKGLARAVKHGIRSLTPQWVALYRVPTSSRTLYLTFDDGPTEHTAPILDALRRHNARATFFLLGRQVEAHPDLARRIVEEGHAVGSHTHTHVRLPECGAEEVTRELADSRKAIEAATGAPVNTFRPPWGKIDLKAWRIARRQGMDVILWTVDSMDYLWTDPQRIADRLRDMTLRSGDVLLFHDDYPHTVAALDPILKSLSGQGWSFEALPSPAESSPAPRRETLPRA